MLGNVIMREGLLPGSSYWVPVYAGVSKHSTADETEFGKTQVVRAGREDQGGGSYANKLLHNSEFWPEY